MAGRPDPMAITRDGAGADLDGAWRLTERYLVGVHRLACERGIPFAVVVYPHPHQVGATESLGRRLRFALPPGLFTSEVPFQRIEALGRREGFPVVNLLHHFRRRRAVEGPLYWEDDIHHNPRGARGLRRGHRGRPPRAPPVALPDSPALKDRLTSCPRLPTMPPRW